MQPLVKLPNAIGKLEVDVLDVVLPVLLDILHHDFIWKRSVRCSGKHCADYPVQRMLKHGSRHQLCVQIFNSNENKKWT